MPGYYGDQAVVIPDNAPALIHFSDEFERLNQQRQRQQLALQKMDQDRRDKITTYLGNRLNNKDFTTNSTYQGMVDNQLNDVYGQAVQMLRSGSSLDDVAAMVEPKIRGIKSNTDRVNALDANILSAATNLKAQNPGLDVPALVTLARHDASYQKDDNGNFVLRDPRTIDPTQDHVRQAYINHYPLLYSPESSAQDLTNRLDKAKLADVSADNTYDAKGNLISPGYKGQVPGFVNVTRDAKGNPTVAVDGQNYRLPGANNDYVDQNGNPVKVASDRLFSQFYNGAMGAGIEKKVDALTAIANQPKNSPYADMLRRKFLYDTLQSEATGRYKLSMPKDESFQRKNQLLGRDIQTAHLRIAEDENARQNDKWNTEKPKLQAGQNADVIPYTDQLESKAQTFTNPIEGRTYKYIDTKDIDPKMLDIITGNTYQKDGTPSTHNVQAIDKSDGSGKIFIIDSNGNWVGKDGQIIDRTAAFTRQLNSLKKNKESQPPAYKPASMLNASYWINKFKNKK